MKQLKMVRPMFGLTGPIAVGVGADVDFSDFLPTTLASINVGSQALWDVTLWDAGVWTTDFAVQRDWATVAAVPGVYFSLTLVIASNGVNIQWMATDFVFERSRGAIV
jgi:hypothetical protein